MTVVAAIATAVYLRTTVTAANDMEFDFGGIAFAYWYANVHAIDA